MLDAFCGLWIDDTGRVLAIDRVGDTAVATVSSSLTAEPITGAPTLESVAPHRMTGLTASWVSETRRLRIEVGTPGLGPTYELEIAEGGIELHPSVHMGLYDDFDDDLGVPWAEPLRPYRRATPDQARVYAQRSP